MADKRDKTAEEQEQIDRTTDDAARGAADDDFEDADEDLDADDEDDDEAEATD